MKVIEVYLAPKVNLNYKNIELTVRLGSDNSKRREILESWDREQFRELAANLIAKWEKKMNLKVTEFGIKKNEN